MKRSVGNEPWVRDLEKIFYKISFFALDQYFRFYRYIRNGEYRKIHLSIQRESGQLKVILKPHRDFVAEVQQKIDDFIQDHKSAESVRFALQEALGGCAAIEIRRGKEFVQFWTTRGRLDLNIQLFSNKKNKKIYYQLLGMLSEMNFIRNTVYPTEIWPSKNPEYFKYKVEDSTHVLTIDAYFVKNLDLATEFVLRVFTEVYNKGIEDLRIRVA